MRNRVVFTILFVLLSAHFYSCGVGHNGTKRSNRSQVESFLVENGSMQYFVKQLTFVGPAKQSLYADVTVRAKADNEYKARFNFNIEQLTSASIDSFQLVNSATQSVILTEQPTSANRIVSGRRFFALVNNNNMYNILSIGTIFYIKTFEKEHVCEYSPTKKTKKILSNLQPSLLD